MRRLNSRKHTGQYEISQPTHLSHSASNRALGLFTIGATSSHPDERAFAFGYIYINADTTPAHDNSYGHTAGLSHPTRACGNKRCRSDQATTGIHHLPATLL